MTKHLKKTLLIALAGAFVLTGAAAYNMPNHSAAAPYQMKQTADQARGQYNKQFDAAQYSQMLADDFGVDKNAVEKALEAGWRPNDLQRAAFIAYACDKSLDDVLNAKTPTNSWRDVSDDYGITSDKYYSVMQQLHCQRIAAVTGVDNAKLASLINDGYYTRDIAMAAALANKSGKSIDDVIGMKKVNNSWYDIAESLGVNQDDIDDLLYQCGPHHMNRHGFGGPGPRMRGYDANYDDVSRHGGWHHRGNYRGGDCYYGDGYRRHC